MRQQCWPLMRQFSLPNIMAAALLGLLCVTQGAAGGKSPLANPLRPDLSTVPPRLAGNLEAPRAWSGACPNPPNIIVYVVGYGEHSNVPRFVFGVRVDAHWLPWRAEAHSFK